MNVGKYKEIQIYIDMANKYNQLAAICPNRREMMKLIKKAKECLDKSTTLLHIEFDKIINEQVKCK